MKNKTLNNRQKALDIIMTLENINFKALFLCGEIQQFSQDQADVFKELGSDYIESFCIGSSSCNTDDYNAAVGQKVSVQFKNYQRLFYGTWDSFFNAPANYESFPNGGFYLDELKKIIDQKSEEPLVQCYVTVIDLNKVLKKVCDDSQPQNYTFLGFRKIVFKVEFCKSDLDKFHENSSREKALHFIGLLNDDKYIDEKKEIFKSRLVKFVEITDHSNIYQHFLSDFNTFYGNFLADYQLFTRKFSIDSLRNKLLEEKNNYKRRINDILVTIQGRIIALPIASMLSISQMKTDNSSVNVALFMGVIVVSVLNIISLDLQWINLGNISEELNDLKTKLREYTDSQSQIDPIIKSLRKSIFCHYTALFVIFFLVLGIIVVTYVFVSKFSPDAFEKAYNFIF